MAWGGGRGEDSLSALIELLMITCFMLRLVYLGIALFESASLLAVHRNETVFVLIMSSN